MGDAQQEEQVRLESPRMYELRAWDYLVDVPKRHPTDGTQLFLSSYYDPRFGNLCNLVVECVVPTDLLHMVRTVGRISWFQTSIKTHTEK